MHLEITAPLGVLGLTLGTLPERTRVEFEQTASVSPSHYSSSLLISGSGVESAVAAFEEHPVTNDVSFVTETAEGSIYRLTWGGAIPEIIEHVRDTDGTIVSAVAENDTWTFDLRFPDQNAVSNFYDLYDDPDHPITIQKMVSNSTSESRRGGLTAKQQQALKLASDAGFFDVPRDASLGDLANELGISDQAVSERLRRGIASTIRDNTQRSRHQSSIPKE